MQNPNYRVLSNGIKVPGIMFGTSIWDLSGSPKVLFQRLKAAVDDALSLNISGFDTASEYYNESLLGDIFARKIAQRTLNRSDLFVSTKIGNAQQRTGNMERELNKSLDQMQMEYVDLLFLHWPLPEYWLDNWEQLIHIWKKGKARLIGIANCRERHLLMLKDRGFMMPHVVQVEHHPFRCIPDFLKLCSENGIQLQAYSANCLMLPFVRNNSLLRELSTKYNRTITQIILRWHIQHGVIPIFRSFQHAHILENADIFDFSLEKDDMRRIFELDRDYKFHPESVNCPGY